MYYPYGVIEACLSTTVYLANIIIITGDPAPAILEVTNVGFTSFSFRIDPRKVVPNACIAGYFIYTTSSDARDWPTIFINEDGMRLPKTRVRSGYDNCRVTYRFRTNSLGRGSGSTSGGPFSQTINPKLDFSFLSKLLIAVESPNISLYYYNRSRCGH